MRIDAVLVDLGGVWLQDGSFAEREQWAAAHGLTADELFAWGRSTPTRPSILS